VQREWHLHVRRRHVDPGPEHVRPVFETAGPHALEELEALFDRPVPVRTRGPRLGHGAALRSYLLHARAVHVRLPVANQLKSMAIKLLEVVGRVARGPVPLEAQPAYVLLDRPRVSLVLGRRVRVVEAEVAGAPVLLRDLEVETDCRGMTDVQKAVRFGRKARDHNAAALPGRHIARDHLPYEVRRSVGPSWTHAAFRWVLSVDRQAKTWKIGPRSPVGKPAQRRSGSSIQERSAMIG
jgi:hypothetical protein